MKEFKGKVLCVMPTYMRSAEDWEMTKLTLLSLAKTVPEEHYIMVVDDASPYKEGQYNLHQLYCDIPQMKNMVVKSENKGFANSVNYGIRTALHNDMDCILVNADMEFPKADWFHCMIGTNAAVVGAKLLYPTGLIQHAGIYFSIVTRTFDHLHKFAPSDLCAANFARRCPVTGALQFISNQTMKEVGYYDEDFKMGWEDVDYCLRVFLSGRSCVYNPDVVAIHHESAFRGNRDDKIDDWTRTSYHLLYEKHAGVAFGEYVPMLVGQDPMAGGMA